MIDIFCISTNLLKSINRKIELILYMYKVWLYWPILNARSAVENWSIGLKDYTRYHQRNKNKKLEKTSK